MSKYKAHIISMALIGFWHGASWTFVVFGLYWGAVIAGYLAIVDRATKAQDGAPIAARAAFVSSFRDPAATLMMFAVVCVGWVFFRAVSIGDAWYVLTHAFAFGGASGAVDAEVVAVPILWALIAGLCAAEWLYRHFDRIRPTLEGGRLPAIAGRYALIAAIIVSTGASQLGEARPFIYFQF
jgi:alginate O-acetyltransferase complex protein AlgI